MYGLINIKTLFMKKVYPALMALTLMMAIACGNDSDKDKNGMDSIAATPNPISTDTLRMNSDTMKRDSLHRHKQ